MVFHISALDLAVVYHGTVRLDQGDTVILHIHILKEIKAFVIDTLRCQLCLHFKLVVLHVGEISVKHAHNKSYSGYKNGQSNKADGTENAFCHIFPSIL